MRTEMTAGARWRVALDALSIPEPIVAAAPESPYGFPSQLFRHSGRAALTSDSPSRRRALEALPDGGSVLDVGAGGGAASLPLVPPAGRLVAVDQSAELLDAFAAAADEAGVEHSEKQGRWPDVAEEVAPADVLVCHHVLYNVPDLEGFATSLSERAKRRVVTEVTARHPMTELNDLWQHFHGLKRPEGPSHEDARAVLEGIGLSIRVEHHVRPSLWMRAPRAEVIAFIRKRLCLAPDNDEEIEELVGDEPESDRRAVTTLWWDV